MSPLGIARLRVDPGRCTGCGACVTACPAGAISLEDGIALIVEDLCRACEACVAAGPQGAIVALRSGEVLPAPSAAAESRPQAGLAPAPSGGVLARLATGALPALGTALAVVGRDVLLHAVDVLIDRWAGGSAPTDALAPRSTASPSADGRGARHRYRGGRA